MTNRILEWIINNTKYPSVRKTSTEWIIFTQSTIDLKPKEGKKFSLNVGYRIKDGIIFVSLVDTKNLGISNNVFIETNNPNIEIYIYNFTKNRLLYEENIPFCYVKYLK